MNFKTGKKNLSSYKSSIFLSAITTVAGLGVLLFAKHPALRSIAFVSVTGILCVVLIFIQTILNKTKHPFLDACVTLFGVLYVVVPFALIGKLSISFTEFTLPPPLLHLLSTTIQSNQVIGLHTTNHRLFYK